MREHRSNQPTPAPTWQRADTINATKADAATETANKRAGCGQRSVARDGASGSVDIHRESGSAASSGTYSVWRTRQQRGAETVDE